MDFNCIFEAFATLSSMEKIESFHGIFTKSKFKVILKDSYVSGLKNVKHQEA